MGKVGTTSVNSNFEVVENPLFYVAHVLSQIINPLTTAGQFFTQQGPRWVYFFQQIIFGLSDFKDLIDMVTL